MATNTGRFNAAIDDYEDYGPTCNVCGAELEWEDCGQCSGAGWFDEYEFDAINFLPDEEYSPCCLCLGEGGGYYCPNYGQHALEGK